MGWLQDGVSDEEHEGCALGVLANGVIPTHGTGNATFEMAFQNGWWSPGSNTRDPGVDPAWLLPACVCGWRGDRVPYDPRSEDGAGAGAGAGSGAGAGAENVARAQWDAHMDEVTVYLLPVAKAVEMLVSTLETARDAGSFDGKPLGTIRALQAGQAYLAAQIAAAVGAARAQELSWELIGKALGVTRQTAHERYRDVEAMPARRTVSEIAAARR